MKIERAALAFVAAGLGGQGAAEGRQRGDVARGAVIAKRWCVNCHVVAPDQTSGKVDVPTFADIARRRTDDRALSSFLVEPHPPMPNLNLTRQEIDDVVAYIRGLDANAPSVPPARKEPKAPTKG